MDAVAQVYRGAAGKRHIINDITTLISGQTDNHHNIYPLFMRRKAARLIKNRASLEELRNMFRSMARFSGARINKHRAEIGAFDNDDSYEQYIERRNRMRRHEGELSRELILARDPRGVIERETGFSTINYSARTFIRNGGDPTRENFVLDFEHRRFIMAKYREYYKTTGELVLLARSSPDHPWREFHQQLYTDGTFDTHNLANYEDEYKFLEVKIQWITHPERAAEAAEAYAAARAYSAGCSSKTYMTKPSFTDDSGRTVQIQCYSLKSKGHNCVTACFAFAAHKLGVTVASDGIAIPKMHKSIVRAANAYALACNAAESDFIPLNEPKSDHHIQLLANYFGLIMRRHWSTHFFAELDVNDMFAPENLPEDAPTRGIGFDVLARPDEANVYHYEFILQGAPVQNRTEQVSTTAMMKRLRREKLMAIKREIRTLTRKADALRGDTSKAALFQETQEALADAAQRLRLEERSGAVESSAIRTTHLSDEDFASFEDIARHIVTDAKADCDNGWIIDGPAGTGKSHLVNIIQRVATEMHVPYQCTAMTGAAADRIDNAITLDLYLMRSKHSRTSTKQKMLIIDEISMCDSSKFDEIAAFAKQRKMALVLVGDNFQLPPVAREVSGMWMQGEFMRTFAWKHLHLTQIRRTQNVEFAALQKRIHDGEATAEDFDFLASRFDADADPRNFDLTIASKNAVVDSINATQLAELAQDAERRTYAPVIVQCDASNPVACRKRDRIINKRTITLCVGAHVMMTHNHPESLYVNGTTGTIVALSENTITVRAKVRGTETLIECERISNDRHSSGPLGGKLVQYTFFPMRLAYAITIHKAQGLSHSGTLLYICDAGFVQPGMYYTAISRVTDPANLTIKGVRVPTTKMLERDPICVAFANGEYVPTLAEQWREKGDDDYYAPGIASEPISCAKKTSSKPEHILCFDFETASRGGEIAPYLCSYSDVALHWTGDQYTWRTESSGVMSDIVGTPADVAEYDPDHSILERMTDKILALAYNYERQTVAALRMSINEEGRVNRRSGHRFGKFGKSLRKHLNAACPMISAYNGSSFDLYFIARYLLSARSPLDLSKYRVNVIMKGSAAVSFSILSVETNIVILRAHDLYQVLLCPLKTACENYLPANDPENKKIDFKAEIMDISAELFLRNWTWQDLTVKRTIITYEATPEYMPESKFLNRVTKCKEPGRTGETQSVSRSFGSPRGSLNPSDSCGTRVNIPVLKEYVPADVIAYCARDTDVLPKLYEALHVIVQEVLNVSAFSFLTLGGMAWYGAIQSARPMLCPKRSSTAQSAHKDRRDVDLYSLNTSQDRFTRRSIIGGRACPRICYGSVRRGQHGSIYLDVSGMYMSILERGAFPHGKPAWITAEFRNEHLLRIEAQANRLKRLAANAGMHPIHFAPMGPTSSPEGNGKVLEDFFIADVEFEENPASLEPVIPEKTKTGTRFVLGRRHAIITSYDLLLILLNGGTCYGCGQMLAFPSSAQWMGEWAKRCRQGKMQAKREKKPAKVAFWKTLANGSYGQLLRRDHSEEYRFIAHEAQLFDFLNKFDMTYAIISDDSAIDIVYGTPKDVELSFLTTRPTYVGAFVLAYTRAMIQQIVQIANPTNDPALQPALGDTDSLLIPYEGAMRLREFKGPDHYIGHGVRSDENAEDDDLAWFPANGKTRAGQLADELLDSAMGYSKVPLIDRSRIREYDSVQMEVIRWFSPAPKVLACVVRDPVTGNHWTKFRTKGVSANAVIGAPFENGMIPIMSAGALFAQERAFREHVERAETSAGMTGDMGARLKKVSPSSVPASEKNAVCATSSAFTIRETSMRRTVLTHRWNGRQYIGNGITIPIML